MKFSITSKGPPSFDKALQALSMKESFRQLKSSMLKYVKGKLTQETFSTEAQKTLAKSVSIEVKGEGLVITAKNAAWTPYIGGQKPQQMTWLTKAKAPIPIVTESGKVIFRSATPRSMREGKWMHPGRAPFTLMERAGHEARKFLNGHLYKTFQEQLRKALR